MTCKHVLGLIDAGPLVNFPAAHLESAWQHARQCATCGPALDAATALASSLAALPQAAPPPDLAAAVLARLSRIDERHPVASVFVAETRRWSSVRDWSTWATVSGGVAAGLAIIFSPISNATTPLDIPLLSTRGMTSVFAVLPTPSWALVLAAGLGLFVAGLFAPLGRNGSRLHQR